jgi:hypothetical protein
MMRLAMTLAIGLAPIVAGAQTVVGRAIVDGRPVTLYDNKSWAFSGELPASCKELSQKLTFCGSSDRWTPMTPPTPEVIAAYRHDNLHYGQFVVEDVGKAQGLTMTAVRDFVLQRVDDLTGSPPIVISSEPVDIAEFEGETLVYSFTISGLETVYANTILLGETTLLQVITYEYGADYTPKHAELHAEFLKAAQVKE